MGAPKGSTARRRQRSCPGNGAPPRYCLVTNISRGGVRIDLNRYLKLADEFELRFSGDAPAGINQAGLGISPSQSSPGANIGFPANREFNREFLFFEAGERRLPNPHKIPWWRQLPRTSYVCDSPIRNAMTVMYKKTNCQPTAKLRAAEQRNPKPVLLAAGRDRYTRPTVRRRFEATNNFFLPMVLSLY
jgi:hypothetical protein